MTVDASVYRELEEAASEHPKADLAVKRMGELSEIDERATKDPATRPNRSVSPLR